MARRANEIVSICRKLFGKLNPELLVVHFTPRKTTTYQCKQCKLLMYIVPCFELSHTKVDPIHHLEQV